MADVFRAALGPVLMGFQEYYDGLPDVPAAKSGVLTALRAQLASVPGSPCLIPVRIALHLSPPTPHPLYPRQVPVRVVIGDAPPLGPITLQPQDTAERLVELLSHELAKRRDRVVGVDADALCIEVVAGTAAGGAGGADGATATVHVAVGGEGKVEEAKGEAGAPARPGGDESLSAPRVARGAAPIAAQLEGRLYPGCTLRLRGVVLESARPKVCYSLTWRTEEAAKETYYRCGTCSMNWVCSVSEGRGRGSGPPTTLVSELCLRLPRGPRTHTTRGRPPPELCVLLLRQEPQRVQAAEREAARRPVTLCACSCVGRRWDHMTMGGARRV